MLSNKLNVRWRTLTWFATLLLIAPMVIMLIAGIGASVDLFTHLWQTVLPDYILNTLLLAIIVIALVLLFGVTSAVIVVHTNVYAKQVLRWALLLPLAMPAYLVAYLYTDLFDYAGPVQRTIRAWFAWQSPNDYWFFDIRTLPGAATIIALVLYPYVYMLTRNALSFQDQSILNASQTLGLPAKKALINVAIPMARPAIVISCSLVLMETMADFATVHYFSVNTLTTAIYDTWLGYGDLASANLLASVLMLLILFAVVSEQKARAQMRHQSNRITKPPRPIVLSRTQQILASVFCWGLVAIGFLLPFVLLLLMAIEYSDFSQIALLTDISVNSVKVSVIAATIAAALAVLYSMYQRFSQDKNKHMPMHLSGFGYAVPGTVLAMALLATFGPLDHGINALLTSLGIDKVGLIFSGSIFAIIFAFVVRFAAIANGTVNSGMDQIAKNLDYAPLSLGLPFNKMLIKVHLPILSSTIWIAWLLVFIESMKELPAVLLLRPFNFETLSTHIYQLISDEMLEQGAIGAIFIVLLGLFPIIWLNRVKEAK